jgi:hypothetical protein
MHLVIRAAATFALAVYGAACTDNISTPELRGFQASASSATFTIAPASASVAKGGTLQLSATRDSAGHTVPVRVTWLIRDRSIASVDANGLVTGLAVGTTLIGAEASDGSFATATLDVTTSAPSPAPTPTPNSTSLQLQMASYFGGRGSDMVRDIAVDGQGNVFVAGSTASSDFPVVGRVFDASFNSGGTSYHDAFIAKVSPAGQLLWSTYLGGTGFDRIYALELDPQGFVYVAGRAGPNFPVTAGAFQRVFAGGDRGGIYGAQDGFVCKFRGDGTRVWCSYFGDSDVLAIRDLAVDGNGDVYVGAATSTGTFPAAWFANAAQKTKRGGFDLVIAKIRSDGTRVLWATYLGGSRDEVTTPTIRVDAALNVVVFTGTTSTDIPTPNGFDRVLNGASDGYVAKISSDGSRIVWGTFLGGSGRELNETHSMALDPLNGDVIVAAGTTSTDFPTTTGALQRRFGGMGGSGTGSNTNYPGDAFVTRIAASGSRIVASTYLGGIDGDGAEGVWIDRTGAVHVSGTTYSSDFVVTASGASGSTADVFVVKLAPNLATRDYASRLGGTRADVGRACFVDAAGNTYAVAELASGNMTTLRAFQPQSGGGIDGGVFKFIPN